MSKKRYSFGLRARTNNSHPVSVNEIEIHRLSEMLKTLLQKFSMISELISLTELNDFYVISLVTLYSRTVSSLPEYLIGSDFDTKKHKAKNPKELSESFVCELIYSQ